MSAPQPISPDEAETALRDLNQELNRLQRTIRLAIQEQLSKMVGRSFDDLQKNRELADSIHQLLDSHGLRVCCLECGHPAILRVSPRGDSSGVFVFDHTFGGLHFVVDTYFLKAFCIVKVLLGLIVPAISLNG